MVFTMKKLQLSVGGMSCSHCVAHVENALRGVTGVSGAEVDLKSGSALVELDEAVPEQALRDAVADAGYEVTAVQAAR